MSLLARFRYFIVGILLGILLVFFFFGDKVKEWFFHYSSSGRIINHLIEPRYTLIYNKDTIADYLSVQGLFSVLESNKAQLGIQLVSFDSLNQIEEPVKYIKDHINKIKDGTIIIKQKNIFHTNRVLNKIGLKNNIDSLSYKIIDDLILNSKVKILKRGDCYKYSLMNTHNNQTVEFIFESCDSIIKLIDLH